MENVPYIVHESAMVRQERTIRRLWIFALVLLAALIFTNAGWIWYESQFEEQEIVQTVRQNSEDGGNNTYSGSIVGGDINGESGDRYQSETESP